MSNVINVQCITCKRPTQMRGDGKGFHRFCEEHYKEFRNGEQRKRNHDQHQRLKFETMYEYSDGAMCCACCGEDEFQFMTLDHIAGGGSEHRRKEVKDRYSTIYHWAKANGYPRIFQVLCFNCNTAKYYFGQCPHERRA